MKNGIVLFLVLLIFSTGCRSFNHARYRKLDKVPAHGIAASLRKPAMKRLFPKAAALSADTEKAFTRFIAAGNSNTVADHSEKRFVAKRKTAGSSSARPLQERKQLQQPHQLPPDREIGTVVVIFIFLFAVFLVFSGSALLIVGLYNGINWMIALGAAYLLLAVPPAWAFLRDLFGKKSKSDPKERKRR
jgi:hypothetical protein